MKIDLHCHTKAVRSGELQTRNVTKERFKEAIVDAGVEIVAITNHDIFDACQYREFVKHVGGSAQIWPGIEFAVYRDDNKFHMIIIANPASVNRFERRVKALLEGAEREPEFELDAILSAFRGEDVIFMPHFAGKSPAISVDTLRYLQETLGQKASRVIVEDTNVRSTLILTDHDFNAVTGSDVKNWEYYGECTVSNLRLTVDSFEQFCMLIERDKQTIDGIIKRNTTHIYTTHPSKEDRSITVPVELYKEVNVIFGDKGTGKSNILTSIEDEARTSGLRVEVYRASQKDDDFDALLDVSDMGRVSTKLSNMPNCKSAFDLIKSWTDETPTPLYNYHEYSIDRERRESKNRIKLLDNASHDSYSRDRLASALSHRQEFCNIENRLLEIANGYAGGKDLEKLRSMLDNIRSKIGLCIDRENVKISETTLYNSSITIIQQLVSAKTGTTNRPVTTGFYEYAKNRIDLKKSLDQILGALSKKEEYHIEYKEVGSIGDKGIVSIASRWSMLGDKGHERYECKITSLKSARSSLEKLRKGLFAVDMTERLAKCRESLEGLNSLDDFIGIEKYPTLNQKRYTPSSGEKAILMIQRALNNTNVDMYILDEPEMSLGGLYIDSVIRSRISDLGRQGKIVVIATHNANLAVRTLPYSSMLRTYRNGSYNTYTGNPFVGKLTNIIDGNDVLSWREESMKTLEGGKEAFGNRGDIYESGK